MEFKSGNIFVRPIIFETAGQVIEGHSHNFDHTTYIPKGSVRIEALDDLDTVIKSVDKLSKDGRNWVLIKAGVRHRLTALEDGSIAHCIYSHRNPQGDILQEWDGWTPAYV